jgi:hypothetical protein
LIVSVSIIFISPFGSDLLRLYGEERSERDHAKQIGEKLGPLSQSDPYSVNLRQLAIFALGVHLCLTIWRKAAYEFWYQGMVFDTLFFNSTEVDARRPGKFGGAWSR